MKLHDFEICGNACRVRHFWSLPGHREEALRVDLPAGARPDRDLTNCIWRGPAGPAGSAGNPV